MKLRLQTDYALRTLIFLAGHAERRATAEEIAEAFVISKDHLVKIIQQLTRIGFVRTFPGRGGGLALAKPQQEIALRQVVEMMEGTTRVLDCVEDPAVCPMEPGCRLRKVLMTAENAFYEKLDGISVADLVKGKNKGGLHNLSIGPPT